MENLSIIDNKHFRAESSSLPLFYPSTTALGRY